MLRSAGAFGILRNEGLKDRVQGGALGILRKEEPQRPAFFPGGGITVRIS